MRWLIAAAAAQTTSGGDLADQLPVKSVGGTGDAECRDDRTGVVSHRCGDRFEAPLEFLDRAGVPIPRGLFRRGHWAHRAK
jgi:hypothetical protein